VSSSATTSPRPGDRGFESRPSSGESTANPVGLAQVEYGQCGGDAPCQAQRCGWRILPHNALLIGALETEIVLALGP
jgi:hypothetical protein